MNLQRLNGADRLIAMSDRVAEIYRLLGVNGDRLRTMQLTLAHIEQLRPRRPTSGKPITFATLGGLESNAKGAGIVLTALRSLRTAHAPGDFRMLVFGWPTRDAAAEAASLPGVELRGPYEPGDLDSLLEEVDVGIVPSTWEEAYGYAGIEFLAKGIPVIGNEIGAIPEYVRNGETGWLNVSRSGEELAMIMKSIVAHPNQIIELNENLRAAHAEIVKPLDRHVEEMDDVYAEVLASRPGHPLDA